MEILGDFQTSVIKALDEIDNHWKDYNGIIICGSHTPHDMERYLQYISYARENLIPYLGICLGYQLAAIEYARNVLKIEDATSEEWGKGTYVVKKRKNGVNVGEHNGETYWNNYEVDLLDWEIPKNFFITQAHPEYQSSLFKPHPLLVSFLAYAKRFR